MGEQPCREQTSCNRLCLENAAVWLGQEIMVRLINKFSTYIYCIMHQAKCQYLVVGCAGLCRVSRQTVDENTVTENSVSENFVSENFATIK